jgi:F-type H+-transporting ATPase subunit epsilon
MTEAAQPARIQLEVVTPEGLLLRDDVDDVVVPGEDGYFGVRPGHTPFFTTLGLGVIVYTRDRLSRSLTCFAGFCEVLPDRVSILAQIGERAEDIDLQRAEEALARAETRMQTIRDQEGYEDTRQAFQRAVTRLAVARRRRA